MKTILSQYKIYTISIYTFQILKTVLHVYTYFMFVNNHTIGRGLNFACRAAVTLHIFVQSSYTITILKKEDVAIFYGEKVVYHTLQNTVIIRNQTNC